INLYFFFFFFSSRRRHTRCGRDWSSDVCSSDLKSRCGKGMTAFQCDSFIIKRRNLKIGVLTRRIDLMKRLASRLTWWHMPPHKSTRGLRRRRERPAMDHIGIDVHKRVSQIYILAEEGEVIERRIRVQTHP